MRFHRMLSYAYIWRKAGRGWTMMAHTTNGKMVCRYFWPEVE